MKRFIRWLPGVKKVISSPEVKRRKGTLVKIEKSVKEYFCIFFGRSAQWTAYFDAGNGAKLIERYCSKCANHYVDDK